VSIVISPCTNSSLPGGVRVYAVGDIHGRLDLLDRLLALIAQDRSGRAQARTLIVFLGDYVDRGRNSKGVITRLIEGLPADVKPVFLKGNHEDLLLSFLDDPLAGINWLQNGGDFALLSYGVEREVIENAFWWSKSALIEANAQFRDLLPDSHREFYRALKFWHREGDYFFVHAGVKPGVELEDQAAQDLLWIRNEFLRYRGDFGATVVHGHTPDLSVHDLPNRIGIDTYAVKTGRLTAVGLEGSTRWFLQT
jgi:serine/threonine protein phosphatase 1